jgi:hypothetical protein
MLYAVLIQDIYVNASIDFQFTFLNCVKFYGQKDINDL